MRAQFAESCVHAKESLKNYRQENSLLGVHLAEGEERVYTYLYIQVITYTYCMFRHERLDEDLEKSEVKRFSRKVHIHMINSYVICYFMCNPGKFFMEIYQVCSKHLNIYVASYVLELHIGNRLTSL